MGLSSSSPDTPRTKVAPGQIALSPAFRALDTHDLRRGLRAHGANRTLVCISRTRHARSPQRVARAWVKSHSRLHFAHSTRTISAEGCIARQVSKTSVSYETSSKSLAETPIGAHTSRSPAKQFRDSSPSKQHPLTRQSQCDSDIHLYHNSQPHDSLRLPRIFPHPNLSWGIWGCCFFDLGSCIIACWFCFFDMGLCKWLSIYSLCACISCSNFIQDLQFPSIGCF